jgi:putative aminopeptidase FrvX
MDLRELTNLVGVSGDEGAVREALAKAAASLCDEILTDSLGNLIAVKGRDKSGPQVLVAAHMDEPGLMISGFHDSGLLRFKLVGDLEPAALLGAHVEVGPDRLPGVIGGKPPHMLSQEQRQALPKVDDLYIDIGAADRKKAEAMVEVGNYAALAVTHLEFGQGLIKARAVAARAACLSLLQLLAEEYSHPFFAAFTVQKEIGLRGARVVAYRVAPSVALVLDSSPCADVPEAKDHQRGARLGAGVTISLLHRSGVGHRPFASWLAAIAEEECIPYQWLESGKHPSDASVVELQHSGIPAATLGIPCRYANTASPVAAATDIQHATALAAAALRKLAKGEVAWLSSTWQ